MTDISELSEREREILHLVATGASNKEIAKTLYISTNTVKVHLRNIFAKIEVSSRTEAAMYAVSAGLVEPVTTTGADGFTVVSGGDDRNRNQASQTIADHSWFGVFVQNPGLIFLLFGFIVAAGLTILFLINRSQPITLASNGSPAVNSPTRWREKAFLPTARFGLAVAAYEDQIYAVGGETGAGITNTLEGYNPSLDRWTVLSPKPTPVTDICAAVIGGLIYVPGGRLSSGEVTDVLEVYDPREDEWQKRSPIPKALSAYALSAFEGKLYLFGGWDGKEYVSDVFEYDPDSDAWIQRTSMPTRRGFSSAAVAGGKIYVMGGFDGQNALSVNEEYLPESDSQSDNPWTERAPMPSGRYAMGVASVVDIVHVFGGAGDKSSAASTIEYFPTQDEWQPIDAPEQQLGIKLGAVLLGTRIYVLGGLIEDKPTASNVEYQAIYTISIPIIR